MWPFISSLCVVFLVLAWLRWRRRLGLAQKEIDHQKQRVNELEATRYEVIAHKQAEQEALFNSMVEGVLVLDRDGKIQLANRALDRMFDLHVDIRGKTLLEAFRLHELHDLLPRLWKEGTVPGVELDLPGIERRSLQVNATVVRDAEKNQQGGILVFHDLTRIKELENTRQEFVANVSHELRTPLSLIKGYVETLLNGAQHDPEVSTRFLQTIDKHADRLTILIEDLLTISRLECGQISMNVQSTDVRAVASRVVEDLAMRAQEKNVSVHNRLPELIAQADPQRLQQVFFNLVDNAIKYGNKDGSIILSGRALDGALLEVKVEDDGPGIPEEAIQRVFERFYRADKGRSREQGGTGLGLSIVKHIVHCHGGKVWVTSMAGEGSSFYFTLPAVAV